MTTEAAAAAGAMEARRLEAQGGHRSRYSATVARAAALRYVAAQHVDEYRAYVTAWAEAVKKTEQRQS